MGSSAVVAMVLYACCQEDELPFSGSERSLLIGTIQGKIALQDGWVVREDGHQVRDEAERLLNVFKNRLGSFGCSCDGQWCEEGIGCSAHVCIAPWLGDSSPYTGIDFSSGETIRRMFQSS
jgi:hypothetical protein